MSALTAISRKKPPLPLRWLKERGLLRGRRRLDYGCGRRVWFGMSGYDPYWKPGLLGEVRYFGEHTMACHFDDTTKGVYSTITCIYVLNVVPVSQEELILKHVRYLLHPDGLAYFVVRRDIPREGTLTQTLRNLRGAPGVSRGLPVVGT